MICRLDAYKALVARVDPLTLPSPNIGFEIIRLPAKLEVLDLAAQQVRGVGFTDEDEWDVAHLKLEQCAQDAAQALERIDGDCRALLRMLSKGKTVESWE